MGRQSLTIIDRDKNKKYTKEEEDDFARQEKEYNAQNSHHGRDAALGTAGVGALGAGAYEAEKHHHGHSTGTTGRGQQYGSSDPSTLR